MTAVVLCFEGDPAIKLYRDLGLAESAMEADDLEEWTVYDVEGYRRTLSPRPDGAVAIGERVGGPQVNELRERLRAHLEWARPDRRWEETPLEDLLKVVEETNRAKEASSDRRSRRIIRIVSTGLAGLIVWYLLRQLTSR